MPFDLDNDRTPKPPRKPEEDEDDEPLPKLVPLEPVSVYLAQLRATGRIGDGPAQAQPQGEAEMRRSEPGLPTGRRLPQSARHDLIKHYAVVDERTWALPGCAATSPRPPVASWKLDLHTERRAPQRVILSCPARNNSMAHAIRTSRKGTFVFGNLAPHATVADLRRMIWSQLLPNPTTAIVLESWGRVLDEESWTLLDYAIKDDAKLQVRLVERPLLAERGLSRVRLFSTALVTRSVPIEPSCSGADLKRAVETALARGQYEWWNEQGEATRIASGITLVAIEAKAAEEGGTDHR